MKTGNQVYTAQQVRAVFPSVVVDLYISNFYLCSVLSTSERKPMLTRVKSLRQISLQVRNNRLLTY